MRTLLYGRHPVYEALRANRRQVFGLQVTQGAQEKGALANILSLCQQRKVPVKFVPRTVLDAVQPGHQGVVLEASDYVYVELPDIYRLAESRREPLLVLLLDSLQDPQNLGTLLRTADAVGVHGIIMPRHRQAEVTPAVVNASSGAVEHLLVVQMNLAQAIRDLKENNTWVIGLEGSPQAQLPERVRLDGSIALIVGSEGEGLHRLVQESCDVLMRLPMRGKVASLNAATAGSVALYLVWQRRGFPLAQIAERPAGKGFKGIDENTET